MSRTYITGVGPPQEKHFIPAYAALVASSIELRSDEGVLRSYLETLFNLRIADHAGVINACL
jgi:hypothetical protein